MNVAACEEIHKLYDALANGSVEIGELPDWMHVRGRVAFYVYQGPYSGLSGAWERFAQKRSTMALEYHGPPGDVCVCDPTDHEGDGGKKLLTILWAPIKG